MSRSWSRCRQRTRPPSPVGPQTRRFTSRRTTWSVSVASTGRSRERGPQQAPGRRRQQRGHPPTRNLASGIVSLLDRLAYGTAHLTNPGWWGDVIMPRAERARAAVSGTCVVRPSSYDVEVLPAQPLTPQLCLDSPSRRLLPSAANHAAIAHDASPVREGTLPASAQTDRVRRRVMRTAYVTTERAVKRDLTDLWRTVPGRAREPGCPGPADGTPPPRCCRWLGDATGY